VFCGASSVTPYRDAAELHGGVAGGAAGLRSHRSAGGLLTTAAISALITVAGGQGRLQAPSVSTSLAKTVKCDARRPLRTRCSCAVTGQGLAVRTQMTLNRLWWNAGHPDALWVVI